jgi:hypothetical protein
LSADALSLQVERFVDAFQGQWYRSVIGYDQNSQRDTFARIGVALSLPKIFAWLRWIFIVLAAAWGAWGVATAGLDARARWSRIGRLGVYGKAESLLARAGLPRSAEMTPREFASWVARSRPELSAISTLAELHYRQRYAGRELSSEEREASSRLLRELSSKL